MFVHSNALYSQCPECYIPIGGNLIKNGSFDLWYAGFSSDYSIGTKGPGYYIVENNAAKYYPPYTGHDRTTGKGNFLIVDGDSINGRRVWYQDVSVNPNTDYYFSCWVSNIFVPPVAQLQFSVNGVEIGPPFSPVQEYNKWMFAWVKWNSGSNTTATFSIDNKVTVFQGNDFGLDDISLTACVPDPFFNIDIGNDTSICSEDSVRLDAGAGFSSYLWNTGSQNRVIYTKGKGEYSVTTGKDDCYAKDAMNLDFLPVPYIGFDSDYILCEESHDSIILRVDPDYQTFWQPSGDTSYELIINTSGNYSCFVTRKDGCTNTAIFEVRNLCYPVHYVPNAFYPNGDGLNDVFAPSGLYMVGYHMAVFNRWGERVFETNDISKGWDGAYNLKPCEEGVYFWVIDYYGLSSDKQKIPGSTKGTVTLLR